MPKCSKRIFHWQRAMRWSSFWQRWICQTNLDHRNGYVKLLVLWSYVQKMTTAIRASGRVIVCWFLCCGRFGRKRKRKTVLQSHCDQTTGGCTRSSAHLLSDPTRQRLPDHAAAVSTLPRALGCRSSATAWLDYWLQSDKAYCTQSERPYTCLANFPFAQ